MKFKMNALSVCLGLIIVFGASAAFAGPPRQCRTGSYLRMYQTGLKNGKDLIKRAWSTVDDCFALESFYDLVEENLDLLEPPANSGRFVACRLGGTADGIFAQLLETDRICVGICVSEGEFLGETFAKLYCYLSIALGGLPAPGEYCQPPLGICGLNMRLSCQITFYETARDYAGCQPYREPPYKETYDAEMHNACWVPPMINLSEEPFDDGEPISNEVLEWSQLIDELFAGYLTGE